MKALVENINKWLQQEAQVVAGDSFHLEPYTCLAVLPDRSPGRDPAPPVGFLAARDTEVVYLDACSPEGARMLRAWLENHPQEQMPAECWYG